MAAYVGDCRELVITGSGSFVETTWSPRTRVQAGKGATRRDHTFTSGHALLCLCRYFLPPTPETVENNAREAVRRVLWPHLDGTRDGVRPVANLHHQPSGLL